MTHFWIVILWYVTAHGAMPVHIGNLGKWTVLERCEYVAKAAARLELQRNIDPEVIDVRPSCHEVPD